MLRRMLQPYPFSPTVSSNCVYSFSERNNIVNKIRFFLTGIYLVINSVVPNVMHKGLVSLHGVPIWNQFRIQ